MNETLYRAVVNTRTGETEYIALTPEEITQKDLDQADAQTKAAAIEADLSNERKMVESVRQAVNEMLQIADKIQADTATPGERTRGLLLCLRGTARLAKIVFDDLTEEV